MADASLRVKVGAWLLLGAWSAGLAEVLSGSSPFVLASAWGLLVTVPLYLLHAVVLLTLVHRRSGRLGFASLYLAGTVFGLYEAYVTKVLWTPTWEPLPVRVAGIHPFETALLVLLWHPLVSFVVPVLVVETVATQSRLALAGLPDRVGRSLLARPRRTVAAVAVALAVVQGALVPSPSVALGANLLTATALVGGVLLWRRRVGESTHRLPDLLPEGRQFDALAGLLGALYVVAGVAIRPAFLPGLGAQATVWGLYLVAGSLLVLRLRADRRAAADPAPVAARVPARPLVAAAAGFVALSVPANLLAARVAPAVLVALDVAAIVVGTAVLGGVVRSLVAGRANA